MKKYELLTILKPNLDNDEADKAIEKIDSDLAELGGKVESRDKMGRRKLAYDIKKSRDGFFVAGDVRTKRLRQISTAVADGANAVFSAIAYLKANE